MQSTVGVVYIRRT